MRTRGSSFFNLRNNHKFKGKWAEWVVGSLAGGATTIGLSQISEQLTDWRRDMSKVRMLRNEAMVRIKAQSTSLSIEAGQKQRSYKENLEELRKRLGPSSFKELNQSGKTPPITPREALYPTLRRGNSLEEDQLVDALDRITPSRPTKAVLKYPKYLAEAETFSTRLQNQLRGPEAENLLISVNSDSDEIAATLFTKERLLRVRKLLDNYNMGGQELTTFLDIQKSSSNVNECINTIMSNETLREGLLNNGENLVGAEGEGEGPTEELPGSSTDITS